ncbi:Uncharacterised protein [Serratia fonticola]|uniref:Uncharacterized protein n=1 Tax=Serratia fonticola TaxID=47917 RepID=A0A4U9V8U6_SERFO|nr:Uncharacterised protein [Serratia fonticola]
MTDEQITAEMLAVLRKQLENTQTTGGNKQVIAYESDFKGLLEKEKKPQLQSYLSQTLETRQVGKKGGGNNIQ